MEQFPDLFDFFGLFDDFFGGFDFGSILSVLLGLLGPIFGGGGSSA